MSSANDRPNYNTIERHPQDPVPEEPVQPITHARREEADEESPEVQGTLGSIMMFLMRQSYIAALIIMMVRHCSLNMPRCGLERNPPYLPLPHHEKQIHPSPHILSK